MKKIVLNLTVIILTVLLTACSLDAATQENNDNNDDSETSVETSKVDRGDLIVDRSFYGRAEPNKMTPVILPSGGEIDKLKVAEGDEIEEDDTIAKLKTENGKQKIKAPEDGILVNLDAEKGDKVSGDDPLAMIADFEKMKVSFEVTTRDKGLFKAEDEREIEYEGNTYDAEIMKVGSMPGDSGLLSVQAKVDNEDLDIAAGSVVEIIVPEKRAEDSLIVPTEAIVDENDESFIFIVNNDKVTKTKIDIDETQSDKTAIKSDVVEDGDEVVVNGQLTLSDGDVVHVIEAEE